MGYTTEFTGKLKFTCEMGPDMWVSLNAILCDELIDYEVTREYDGIKWDGMEKSYDMEEKANFIIDSMKKDYPQFGLQGSLGAVGEDPGDVWVLSIGPDGRAVRKAFGGL